jgi:CRP-like cAMP-binding protein
MVAQAAVRSGGSIFQTNQILATLSETTQAILEKKLEPITLRKGQALYRPYERIEKLYLPVTALVATFVRPIDGMTVGYSITGRDGITGINAALGVDHSPHSVDVISTGESVAIPLAYFQECIKLHSDLKERVLE